MDTINWGAVSALADVVMAITAIVAAVYALVQYRSAINLNELNQLTNMHHAMADVDRRVEKEGLNQGLATEILNLLELHQRAIDHGLMSKNAVNFFREAVTLRWDENEMSSDSVDLLRAALSHDEPSYKHLIAALKANTKTSFIVNW